MNMLPACGYCSALLPRTDQRYCSIGHYAKSTRLPRHTCRQCQQEYAPSRRTSKFCSRPCSNTYNLSRRPARRTGLDGMKCISYDLVELLAAQDQQWWLTSSDLSILLTGEDTLLGRHRIANQIMRLRLRGFAIESRPVIWEPLHAGANNRAYRLVQVDARRREGRAA